MAFRRTAIEPFSTANRVYAGASVTIYGVLAGVKDTSNLVTLYDAQTGTGTLTNPQTLDSEGKWDTPPYIEEAVILEIAGIAIGGHDTGIVYPSSTSGLSWDFESAELAMTADTLLTQAHGLTAVPKGIDAVARCDTADGNFVADDEIPISAFGGYGSADVGAVLIADATNLRVVQGSSFVVLDPVTFNNVTLTAANWRWVLRARLD